MVKKRSSQISRAIKEGIRMKIEDYNKYYMQGSDHYLIPKDVFKELFNEMVNWKEESQKQKKVIDDYKEDISNLFDIINKNCNELKCTSDEWLVIQKYQDKEVKE